MITAPYNFVPLNKKVFYPSWNKKISHDIPFEDGESGMINVTITAKSPIFIRNHYQDGDEFYKNKVGNTISKEFCHIKNSDGSKQYYIPATSIKGMIRNISEIMSFSKIRIDEDTHKKTFSVRDMTPIKYCLDNSIKKLKDCPNDKKRNLFNYPIVATAQKCGFLVKTDNGYKIKDCGKVTVIHQMELKSKYNIDIKNKPIKEKYQKVNNTLKQIDIKIQKGQRQKAFKGNETKGFLVFSGNIDNKKHEFIFIKNGKEKIENKDFDSKVILNFKKVYFEDKNSEIGQYWKGKNKIPIFYTTNSKAEITAIGLTQIFKLDYTKNIFEASVQDIKDNRLDLSETIFGVKSDDGGGLKGRVYFSHIKSNIIKFEKPQKEVEQVLGTPNPTYYPNYIRQTNINGNRVNKYMTLMDENAEISGWKVYPLQNKIQKYDLPTNDKGDVNHDVTTLFKPLPSGTVFKGKIRFHNLKKAEIGALMSALTFHGKSDTHLHNMGMAKALGYGKVNIALTYNNLKYNENEYLESFEKVMDLWEDKEYESWINSAQIIEILAMHNNSMAKSLRYQNLDKSDFSKDKKNKKYLKLYSGATYQPKSKKEKNKFREEEKNISKKKNISIKAENKVIEHNTSTPNPPAVEIKIYSMSEIADEVKMNVDDVIAYAYTSRLPIPKNLDASSELKQAQAVGLINKIKKEIKK